MLPLAIDKLSLISGASAHNNFEFNMLPIAVRDSKCGQKHRYAILLSRNTQTHSTSVCEYECVGVCACVRVCECPYALCSACLMLPTSRYFRRALPQSICWRCAALALFNLV